MRGIVAPPNQHNLVCLGKWCRHLKCDIVSLVKDGSRSRSKNGCCGDLSCNLRKSLKHKGENGRVSILLVSARLHPHSLGLSPDWSLICTKRTFWISKPADSLSGSCFGRTNQTDLLTISPGGLNCFGPAREHFKKEIKYSHDTRKGRDRFYLCPSAIVCTL